MVVAPGSEVELKCKTNLQSDKLLWLYNHDELLNKPSNSSTQHSGSFLQPLHILESKDRLSSTLHLRIYHRPEQYKTQLGLYQVR